MRGVAETPFVGRAQELAALKAALDEALLGKGSAWMVAGGPGIGKTRLAQELGVFAQSRGVLFATGHCTNDDGAPPFLPFLEALNAVLPVTDAALGDRLGDHAPFVARLLPQVRVHQPPRSAPPEMSPETERCLLFEAVTSLVGDLARESGLVLSLDDLHWADKSSLLLLQHLARRLDGLRVLVIGTFRDVEVDPTHPLSVVLSNLRRDGACQRLSVDGLPEEQVKGIIDAVARPGAPAALVRALHRQTDGNPFFLKEIVLHLVQTGVIYGEDGSWTAHLNVDEIGLPESVRDVIGRRLARLSNGCRALLREAAVLGSDFSHDQLAECSGKTAEELLDLMDEALATGLLTELPGHGAAYTFSHALTRHTLLEELSRARRQRLHRQVGQALERLYRPNPTAHMSELAYHFYEAAPLGEEENAIKYAKHAAEAATRALAYEEAARLYDMALGSLDLRQIPDESLRCELLLALGDARMSSGQVEAAREVFARAADLARALGSAEKLARAAVGSGGPWIYGGDDVLRLLEEAANSLGPDEQSLRVRVLTRLVWELGAQGLGYDREAHERRLTLSREALDIARRLNDPAALAHALRARHDALWGPEDTEERFILATEALRLAEETGLKDVEFEARLARIGNLMELGRVDEACAEFDLYARSADRLKRPIYLFHALVIRTKLAIHRGEIELAERLSSEALEMGHRAGYPVIRTHGVQLFAIRREQGRLQELEAAARVTLDLYPTVPGFAASVAALYMEINGHADARSVFEGLAADSFEGVPSDWFWLISVSLLSQVCAYLRDARRAAVLYRLLLPFAERNICVVNILSTGSASRSLGLLATTMSRWDDAERHFDDAVRMNARMGARSALAWTQYDYAQMLIARRHHGDRKRAYTLLSEALEAARALRLRRLEELLSGVLTARRGLAPIYPDGLTRREADVLHLLAEGKSNREISDELVLSLRTVERHITNLYGKIHARGRADATAYALSHGLTDPRPRSPA
jgi:DNA-binding CsgD family transcriptional regulator